MPLDLFVLARPLLHALDPERAHGLTIRTLKYGLVPAAGGADDPILATEVWGRRFASPVGLAAGFDKHAEVMGPMLRLGFGFVEVGSITPRPQPGNPRPRLFRLSRDRAVINRFGFNSEGVAGAAPRLAAWHAASGRNPAGLVGVNLGKNKESQDAAADYAAGAKALAPYADYLVINVSSPNTPGLRALQGRGEVLRLIEAVRAVLPAAPPPLVLKIAPDLTEADKQDIAAVALDAGLDGLIVSNTTIVRPDSLQSAEKGETGGLSGRPLFAPATALLAEMYRLTEGRIVLIGTGGIASGADAYAKIRAGASLVQLYSALVYDGPALVGRIKRDLAGLLRRDGFASVREAVGADSKTAGA